MKIVWLVLLLMVAGSCGADATTTDVFAAPVQGNPERQAALQVLADQVRQQGAISGEFTQEKHLQILTKPIISKGRFSLDPQEFVWQIEQPFAIRYTFAKQKLTREIDGEQQVIEPSAEPMLYGFFSFFTSLFNLSETSLEQYFTVYYQPGTAGEWTIGLTPVQAMLARSLKQLQIRGSATQIHRVQLLEQSGDTTELTFTYPPSGHSVKP